MLAQNINANKQKRKPPAGLDTHMLNNRLAAATGLGKRGVEGKAVISTMQRAGVNRSVTGMGSRAGSAAKLPLSRTPSGSILNDRQEHEAGGEEGKPKGSRFRGKQAGAEAEGNLLNMPGKVVLKGQASSVLSAALAGKADAADALSCRGIFDRRQLTVAGPRKWLLVDERGEAAIVEADKSVLTAQLNLHTRDLRVLDPMLTQMNPCAILCRERAILVNLEHVKCIVTTQYTIVLNVENRAVLSFLDELQKKLRQQYETLLKDDAEIYNDSERDYARMPFELRVMEAALDVMCQHLEQLTRTIEMTVAPMFQTATASKVTTDYLDRLRQMKARMTGIKTRVETMKEVLKKYLEDEDDMLDMNLSARGQGTRHASFHLQRDSLNRFNSLDKKSMSFRHHSLRVTPGRQSSLDGGSTGLEGGSPEARDAAAQTEAAAAQLEAARRAREVEAREEACQEVEMVLQTYFHNLDNTYNKLVTINENMGDVEEFIDLEMDAYRNNMIRMRVLLNASALSGVIVFTVANIMGMNLGTAPDRLTGAASFNDSPLIGQPLFITVTVLTCGLSVMVYLAFLLYLHLVKLGPFNISR